MRYVILVLLLWVWFSPVRAEISLNHSLAAIREMVTFWGTKKAPSTPAPTAGGKSENSAVSTSSAGTHIFGLKTGQTAEQVLSLLGRPQRKDPSVWHDEWWIYNQDLTRYVQIGMKNGKVAELYSNAPGWEYRGIQVGTKKRDLLATLPFQSSVSFAYQHMTVTIPNQDPDKLLFMVEDQPVIVYIDKLNHTVTGIRFLSKEILVTGNFYQRSFRYFGPKPNLDKPVLSAEAKKRVERAQERQIFDLTNVIRQRNNLPLLKWNEQAAQAARLHSRDMMEHRYFDHVSKVSGLDPFERLEKNGIRFRAAGENIAHGQNDGIEAHEGWMNSEGHRSNILNPAFRTLGVGVTGDYYTQNFVTPF